MSDVTLLRRKMQLVEDSSGSRQYDIKVGPGRHKTELFNNALAGLETMCGKKINTNEAIKHFEDIISQTEQFEKFAAITMYPTSDNAILTGRYTSDIETAMQNCTVDSRGRVIPSYDIARNALTIAFYKMLKGELSNFGLKKWDWKTTKIRLSDLESSADTEYGEAYKTGNVKITFNSPIKMRGVKDHLLKNGYTIGPDTTTEAKLVFEEDETNELPKDPPMLVMKESQISDIVDKLVDLLDDYVKYSKNIDGDWQKISSLFAPLINKLYTYGLVGEE